MSRKPSTDPVIAAVSDRSMQRYRSCFACFDGWPGHTREWIAKNVLVPRLGPQNASGVMMEESMGTGWDREGRIVYNWNAELAGALVRTDHKQLPTQLLRNRPWPVAMHDVSALNIVLPDVRFTGVNLHWTAFFVADRTYIVDLAAERFGIHMNSVEDADADAMYILWNGMDGKSGRDTNALRQTFPYRYTSFDDALMHHVAGYDKSHREQPERITEGEFQIARDIYGPHVERREPNDVADVLIANAIRLMNIVTSLVLYTVSGEPDVSQRTPPTSKREHIRTVPDRRRDVIVLDAGWTVGPILAKQNDYVPTEHGDGTGRSPRPHMRRQHWHLYWTGEGRKIPRVNWIAATPILGGAKGKVLV